MNRTRFSFGAFVVFSLVLIGCRSQGKPFSPNEVLRMQRTMCNGTCPSYRVSIEQDGKISYEGFAYVAAEGKRSGQIDPMLVDGIIADLKSGNFLQLKDCDTQIMDVPRLYLTAKVDGQIHSVYQNGGPCEQLVVVKRVAKKIDELPDLKKWVGK